MQIKMAENDLESFFLNKDKKKKSKKVTVINPALLFEQTREAELKKAKKVNEKSQQSQEPKSELLRKTKEDDEWEDNGDVEVDISNLRIGMMPQKIEEVKPKVENNNVNDVPSDESDDENNSKKVDKSAHPWGNKTTNKPTVEILSVSEPSQPGRYVPPNMRGGDTNKTALKQSRKAPNITNSTEFPSLREVADVDTEDGTWSVIKNGHTQAAQPTEPTVKKYILPTKREVTVPEVQPVIEKPKPEKPGSSKYVPPHLRNKQTTTPNENRFAGLKDNSNN